MSEKTASNGNAPPAHDTKSAPPASDGKKDHPHHTYDGQDEDSVPVYPVPERNLGKNGLPTPFISGDLDTYREEWKKTVGEGSDEWWRKVCFAF